jgi:hypothetical protein
VIRLFLAMVWSCDRSKWVVTGPTLSGDRKIEVSPHLGEAVTGVTGFTGFCRVSSGQVPHTGLQQRDQAVQGRRLRRRATASARTYKAYGIAPFECGTWNLFEDAATKEAANWAGLFAFRRAARDLGFKIARHPARARAALRGRRSMPVALWGSRQKTSVSFLCVAAAAMTSAFLIKTRSWLKQLEPSCPSLLIRQHPGGGQSWTIIYLVGLIVIILFILSFFGLR